MLTPDYAVALHAPPPAERRIHRAFTSAVGRLAIRSLYRELMLAPKPGLVSPVDSGSHRDMDVRTFMRSLHSLRRYFPAIARCGVDLPAFADLQKLGIAAEAAMLRATGGVNTHRGAIFNLGLLCAAAGVVHTQAITTVEISSHYQLQHPAQPLASAPNAHALCETVRRCWGDEILASGQSPNSAAANSAAHGAPHRDPSSTQLTHGLEVVRRYGVGGARAEAAGGFATALHVGLPAYQAALVATADHDRAAAQALFALIATLDDTNLLWRGGPQGLLFAQQLAQAFLDRGGVIAPDWHREAEAIHQQFVARNLSPGGAADLLGVTIFLHDIG
jgi:triphosphoribosyl-dephospho-CoA synthase